MTTEVKQLYLKISEQLSSEKHPLVRICTKFHQLFNDDVDAYSEGICDQSPEEIKEFCDDTISQVKQFMYILYGSCVRFYSTVVEWTFLQ
jgi:hypothetical protein